MTRLPEPNSLNSRLGWERPLNPFFCSDEAGAKGLPPLSPAPQILAQPKPSLRSGRFQLTMPNTSCTIITPASLRSDCCSRSFRNAVRLATGIDVHLHRNAQKLTPATLRGIRQTLKAQFSVTGERIRWNGHHWQVCG